jgi:serralysin
LALSGNGSIGNATVFLQNGFTFDISGIAASSTSIKELTGFGAVTLGGKTLSMTNQSVSFLPLTSQMIFTGATGNDGVNVNIDAAVTTFSLTGATFNNWTDTTDTITVKGNVLANTITGSTQSDHISGDNENDVLSGGDGNDSLAGNAGADALNGGAGSDTASYESDAAVNVSLDGSIINTGTAAGDTFTLIENLSGSNTGDDVLVGDQFSNTISGNGGADRLLGKAGNDALSGGTGNDIMKGGTGDDRLFGGAGRDFLAGGAGHDVFDFSTVTDSGKTAATRDVITGFVHLLDDINLVKIDASTKAAGNQAFTFIGKAAFHHVAGELHYVQTNAAGTANDKTIISGDTNGDGLADFTIALTGLKTLTAADFIL